MADITETFKIIADSCCDYVQAGEDILSFVTRVPLSIDLDGKTFVDNAELNSSALLAAMAQSPTAPRSACPSPMAFAEACEGPEQDVYIVTLSARVSGTYDSACNGMEMAKAAHPEKNIHIFNSRSAAAGEVAICLKIQELARQGVAFPEVVRQGEEYISSMTTDFVLEDLDVFRKNGRLNHLQAIATSALRIKLVMGASPEGTIVVRAKGLGMNRALTALIDHVKSICASQGCEGRRLVITHCNCLERAEEVRDRILACCPFPETLICRPSGISTMYANDGGIVLAF